ncbi:MAG: HlyD family secretion protein [Parcubacteria bacterium C7867-006]|nr:MAG: HlyD family secretion protein [Parcubacteria bacterium C7867-006]
MKKHFKKLISSPKITIGIAIIIALAIGIVSSINHGKTLAQRSAEINGLPLASSTDISSASPRDLTLAFPIGGRIKSVNVKIGDTVKAGTVLASLDAENTIGAINQAKAAYLVAQTAYDKLVNGASNPDIAVTQASVDYASTALENAKQNLVRDLTTAYSSVNSVVLSNTYGLFSSPQSANPQFSIIGTVQTNQQLVSNVNTEFVDVNSTLVKWQNEISSINETNVDQIVTNSTTYITKVRNYLTDLLTILTSHTQITSGGSQATITADQNAITSAKATVDSVYLTITNDAQAIKSAKASLDQARASLTLKQSPARSEDLDMARAQVQSTQGALQIAQGMYNNTIITAPVDGKIINVSITAGQIATPNTAAIEILSK